MLYHFNALQDIVLIVLLVNSYYSNVALIVAEAETQQQKSNDGVLVGLQEEDSNVTILSNTPSFIVQNVSRSSRQYYYRPNYVRRPAVHSPTYYRPATGYYQRPSYFNTARPVYYQNRPTNVQNGPTMTT